MAGIHQCWKCGYRFESKPELLDHEEVCDGDDDAVERAAV